MVRILLARINAKAVNDVALPLRFHTFPSLPPGKLDQQTGLTRRAAFFAVVSGFQMTSSRTPVASTA